MSSASLLGYVFVLLFSRVLGPEDFGAFSALNSIGLALAIPAGAFQVVTASSVARRGPAAFDLRLPLLVGTAGVLLTGVFSPLIAHVTRLDSDWTPALLGLGLLPLILNGALMGGLLGLRRFGALSLAYLATGLSRVAAAWTVDVVGGGLREALVAVVLASLATTLLLWWMCRDHATLGAAGTRGSRLAVAQTLFRSNSSIGVLMALTSVDVVLARYVLAPVESGEYALVATLGRAPVWVTQFLALAMVPSLARSRSSRAVARTVALVLGVCAVGTALAAIDPRMWITVLGGAAYEDAADLLLPYLGLGTLLALVQIFIVAEMSRGRHRLAAIAWCATLVQVVLCLLLFRDSAAQVLGTAAAAAGCVVLVGVVELVRADRRDREPSSPRRNHAGVP